MLRGSWDVLRFLSALEKVAECFALQQNKKIKKRYFSALHFPCILPALSV